MTRSTQTRLGALALTVLAVPLLTATGAAAQACLGLPQGSSGGLAFSLGLPEDSTTYTLEGVSSNRDTGLLFTGSFTLLKPDVDAFEDRKAVSGSFGYEIDGLKEDVSLCPGAGLGYSWWADQNRLSVPFGVAVGRTFAMNREGDMGFTPFAMPQFLWVRSSQDDIDVTSSDTYFALSGGVAFSVRALVVGGRVRKILEEGTDAVFSVFLGAVW